MMALFGCFFLGRMTGLVIFRSAILDYVHISQLLDSGAGMWPKRTKTKSVIFLKKRYFPARIADNITQTASLLSPSWSNQGALLGFTSCDKLLPSLKASSAPSAFLSCDALLVPAIPHLRRCWQKQMAGVVPSLWQEHREVLQPSWMSGAVWIPLGYYSLFFLVCVAVNILRPSWAGAAVPWAQAGLCWPQAAPDWLSGPCSGSGFGSVPPTAKIPLCCQCRANSVQSWPSSLMMLAFIIHRVSSCLVPHTIYYIDLFPWLLWPCSDLSSLAFLTARWVCH